MPSASTPTPEHPGTLPGNIPDTHPGSKPGTPCGNGGGPLAAFAFCPRCGSHRFGHHDFKSKRCDTCGFVYYLNPSAATVALIENDRGQWCVVRRAHEPARGTLDLPGGFADMGETAEQGVAREVGEETGMQVERVEYLFSLTNSYLYSGFNVPTLDLFFRCRVADTGAARPADDAAEILWIHPEDIHPADFGLDSVRRGVEKLLAARTQAPKNARHEAES